MVLIKTFDGESKDYHLNKTPFPHQYAAVEQMLLLEKSSIEPLKVIKKNGIVILEKDDHEICDDTIKTNLSTTIGILGDKVGSGKTLMTFMLCMNDIKVKPIEKEVCNSNVRWKNVSKLPIGNVINTNLLIVPHNLINQWEQFIKSDTKLKYYIFRTKMNIIDFVKEHKMGVEKDGILEPNKFNDKDKPFFSYLEKYDLIICAPEVSKCFNDTSYNMRSISITENLREKNIIYSFKRLIVDEVDSINLTKLCDDLSLFKWFVSATYYNEIRKKELQSYFDQFWNSQDLYCDDGNCAMVIKNDSEFIESSHKLQPYIDFTYRCKSSFLLNAVRHVVPANILSRLNAGDISGAIVEMGIELTDDTNIANAVLKDYENKIISNNAKIQYEENTMMTVQPSSRKYKMERISNYKKDNEKININIEKLKERLTNMDMTCSICFDEISVPTILPKCNHTFCFECIINCGGRNNKCPMCRTEIDYSEIKVLKDDSIKEKIDDKMVTKLLPKEEHLANIINKKGKYLIFSDFDETFKKIENVFNDCNKRYKVICGTGKSITKMIDNFEKGELDILCLNSQHFGSGMNLQMASDVIIYHKLTDAIYNQVVGRAQRLGRTEQLKVHKLYYSHEV